MSKNDFLKYPIPEIPDDFENISGTDRVLKNISGSGRVSGTRWSLVLVEHLAVLIRLVKINDFPHEGQLSPHQTWC